MVAYAKRTLSVALLLALVAFGCEKKPIQQKVPSFDRPGSVALVCYDKASLQTLPKSCCNKGDDIVPGECPVGLPEANLYAFVTQTNIGEVAVVDLGSNTIVDQEVSIPFASFVPVGGQPVDIASVSDGSLVITANNETSDLSVIDVINGNLSVFENPSLEPATSIDMEGPAARIAIANNPIAYQDRFAFVTQPSLGRLAVVTFDGALCAGGKTAAPYGCLLGYLPLFPETIEDTAMDTATTAGTDAGTDTETDTDTDTDTNTDTDVIPIPNGNIQPYALVASGNTPSLYVGGRQKGAGEWIVEIDGEVMIRQALDALAEGSAPPIQLSDSAIVRTISTAGYSTAAMALEPELERWIYATEDQTGNVLVINLEKGAMETLDNGTPIIDIPGRAHSVGLFRYHEGNVSSPLTFNGTFGFVTSTAGKIYAIDVEDLNENPDYPHPHTIRSAVNEDETPVKLLEPPVVYMAGEEVDTEKTEAYVAIADQGDGGVVDAGIIDITSCAEDDIFTPEADSNGFHFRCDPRRSSQEMWAMEYEGQIGIRGAAVLEEEGNGFVLVRDETKDLCAYGLRTDIRVPDAGPDDLGNGNGDAKTYLGDVLVITSPPTPVDTSTADCSRFENVFLAYKIEAMDGKNGLVLSNNTLPLLGPLQQESPLPTRKCFGQAFSYDIRAYHHFILIGSKTGRLAKGYYDERSNICRPDPREAEGLQMRVIPGVPFSNYYFTFTVEKRVGDYYDPDKNYWLDPDAGVDNDTDTQASADTDTDTTAWKPQYVTVQFETVGGYSPLQTSVGGDVTDIEEAPNHTLLLVDQAGQGLILFNVLDSYGSIGAPIY